MAQVDDLKGEAPDKNLIILQSLVCLLREKNLLSRADVEELREMVQVRVSQGDDHLPCCAESAAAAVTEMNELGDYIGRRYGGKHRRVHQ